MDDPRTIGLTVRDGGLARALAPLASDSVTCVVGFTEVDDAGALYNSAVVYRRGETRGIYRKRHPAIRHSRSMAGTETPIFTIDGVNVGILICRDSTDAALAAAQVTDGAQLLVIPTNNAMPRARAGETLVAEAHAIDRGFATTLGVPVVRADVVGEARGLWSAGASAITAAGSAGVATATTRMAGLLIRVSVEPDLRSHARARGSGFGGPTPRLDSRFIDRLQFCDARLNRSNRLHLRPAYSPRRFDSAYGCLTAETPARRQLSCIPTFPPMNRRQRKKHRLGEFREFGFNLQFALRPEVDPDAFSDAFIEHIEAAGLAVGGGSGTTWDVFVTAAAPRQSVAEVEREALGRWLGGDARVTALVIGALADAWHVDDSAPARPAR